MIKIHGINILNHIRLFDDFVIEKDFNIQAKSHNIRIYNGLIMKTYYSFEEAILCEKLLLKYRDKNYNIVSDIIEYCFVKNGKTYYIVPMLKNPVYNMDKIFRVYLENKGDITENISFSSLEDAIEFILKRRDDKI